MNVTALVESTDHVCCRYRIAAFRPWWEKAGVRLTLLPWPRRWYEWFRLKSQLRLADVVIVQRKLPAWWQLRLLRRTCRYLAVDFDDAVFLRDSYSSKGLHSAGRLRRFANMVEAVDAVVAGNDFLAKQAKEFARNKPVAVIPTCVEPSEYPIVEAKQNDSTRLDLVWVGSSSTLKGLEQIRPLLEKIGATYPNVRLKLICDRPMTLNKLNVVYRPWCEQTEPREIATADVGIGWIPDDDWSRGKCGLKILQYMAASLPVIANPVGVHGEMIEHGQTGFLANGDDEWVGALSFLERDINLRTRMGASSRAKVTQQYSSEIGAAMWLEIFKRVGESRRRVG